MGKDTTILGSVLPMIAFRLSGIDGVIEQTIDELWGYPDETSYGGGYGGRGTLTIQSSGYSVVGTHYFTTGELYEFYVQLKSCYERLSGAAVLTNTECELELNCCFDGLGHVFINGKFQARPDVGNILCYEIVSDQTQVMETLGLLEKVYDTFGGMEGVKNVH